MSVCVLTDYKTKLFKTTKLTVLVCMCECVCVN